MHEDRNLFVLFNADTGKIACGTTPGATCRIPRPGTSLEDELRAAAGIFLVAQNFNGKTVFRVGAGYYFGPGQTEDQVQPIDSDRATRTLTSNIAWPIIPAQVLGGYNINDPNLGFQPRAYGIRLHAAREGALLHGIDPTGAAGQRGADGGLCGQPGPQSLPALLDQRDRRRDHESRRRARAHRFCSSARGSRRSTTRPAAAPITTIRCRLREPPIQQGPHGGPAVDLRAQHRQYGRIQRSADHAESLQLRAGSRQQRVRRAAQRECVGALPAARQGQFQSHGPARRRLGSGRNLECAHRLADRCDALAAGHRVSDQWHQSVRAGAHRDQRRGDDHGGDRQSVRRSVPQQPAAGCGSGRGPVPVHGRQALFPESGCVHASRSRASLATWDAMRSTDPASASSTSRCTRSSSSTKSAIWNSGRNSTTSSTTRILRTRRRYWRRDWERPRTSFNRVSRIPLPLRALRSACTTRRSARTSAWARNGRFSCRFGSTSNQAATRFPQEQPHSFAVLCGLGPQSGRR